MKANGIFILLVIFSSSPSCPAQNPDEAGEFIEGDMVNVLIDNSRAGVINTKFRWPDKTIPYEFASNYPQDLRTLFKDAAAQISSKTCLKVVPRTTQKDYVQVIPGTGCYSNVGRVGGKQAISLPSGCKIIGTFIHEIIHAIGFHHEQSRTDRDDFVKIKYENIKSGTETNFAKLGNNVIAPFGVTYDYGSVMHYSELAFSKDNQSPTIVPIQPNVQIGQRQRMSASDAAKINNMYCK